jgi:hypothetical protein
MAVRTTDELVAGIIEVDSDITLTPFISTANTLVTQCCTELSTDYTAAQLLDIETWLAAHIYTIRDGRIESEKIGPAFQKLQSKVGLGLDSSHYGQMAKRLDYQGGLARLDAKMTQGGKGVISIDYVGTPSTATAAT